MADWFLFALISAVFAGLQSFCNKVSAEKKYDTYYVSAVSSLVSFLVAAALFLVSAASLSGIPHIVYWLAFASGILYIARTVTQLEALQFIHAAIFFPLYKVVGPALVTVIAIAFLGSVLTLPELVGIILSCIVPLLLITRAEHRRQKNLPLGIMLMLASTGLAALVTVVNALGVRADESALIPFMAIAYAFSAGIGTGLYLRRHKLSALRRAIREDASRPATLLGLATGLFQFSSFFFMLLAFAGSDVSIVYSINAHYIVIPVLLSVWLYKEHWNKQKAVALVLSILALILLHR